MAAEDISMLRALHPVLEAADQLYVAVRTKAGPHVTPELLSLAGDRIICLAAASTVKVKRVQADGIAAFAALGADGWCSALASVEVLDPMDPGAALSTPALAAGSPRAVAGFLRSNARELSGAAMDFVRGRLGAMPPHRVLLALTPLAASVAAGDGGLAHHGWSSVAPRSQFTQRFSSEGADPDRKTPSLHDLGPLAELVESGPAVLGWLRSDGAPLALPVQWDAQRSRATLPASMFEACGAAPASPGCVTFDGWSGLGPSGKQGVMLRGDGAAERDGDAMSVAITTDRATTWDGIATQTLPLG
ncbi:MAG TPA: hypothetical protein VM347_28250 [Nonomuraea sp.]|nr:hypothetical protein [Nonomuraea sp.]